MLTVEMAEVRVSTRLTDHIVAYGLGACVGICLYEPSLKVAGMGHVVLPEQRRFETGAAANIAIASPGKFADSAVPLLIDEIARSGGLRHNLRAAIVGGAQIFGIAAGLPGAGSGLPSALEIGERNAHAIRAALELHGIPLCASDIGGSHGRTVVFRVSAGAVVVKAIGGSARVLTVLSRATEEVKI